MTRNEFNRLMLIAAAPAVLLFLRTEWLRSVARSRDHLCKTCGTHLPGEMPGVPSTEFGRTDVVADLSGCN